MEVQVVKFRQKGVTPATPWLDGRGEVLGN